jgi:hypothetical protein
MIMVAERRFPVRIRIGVPPGGFGQCHGQITTWLDENCDADGSAVTPSGMRGILNDAVSSMTRCRSASSMPPSRAPSLHGRARSKIETTEGVFRVRTDQPAARTQATMHRTP